MLTIAEELFPAPTSIGGVDTTFAKSLLEEEKDSLALTRRARSRIHSIFPGWEILAEAGIGSPGSEIIAMADEWRPDLIVVGSQGSTALGRMFFGSVSRKVINEARCSVLVARGRIVEPDITARILVGVDGSEEADTAVEEIASRNWPAGSEVRIVNSTWTIPPASDPGPTAFRVPPLGGCGGFSRTTWLVNEPQPPKGGTLNTVCRIRSSLGMRQSRLR